MSNKDLRAQYRSSEGRAKQGFVSPVGEVDEQQLKEMVGGSVEANSIGTTTIEIITYFGDCWPKPEPKPTQNHCGLTYRPGDVPQC
ncbi:hypothetical protein [Brevibacillus porteri]|uniref:hypothetical protein n=1 Tax=Brevibacillus porteri TaxID=2126350 RepID=UPI003D1E552A